MSLRQPVTVVLAALLLVGGAACADITDRVDELRSGTEETTERARFCLSLARAASALETRSPDTAADAAEEVLVHAPDEVREDARIVVEGIREAEERGEHAWEDPEVRAAVDRLRDRTVELCDPT